MCQHIVISDHSSGAVSFSESRAQSFAQATTQVCVIAISSSISLSAAYGLPRVAINPPSTMPLQRYQDYDIALGDTELASE
jgi:hypothetical protein